MTYKEIQSQLKAFKEQGLTTIALNAKKDVLEAEYNRIINTLVKDAINSEYEDCEAVTITEDLVKEVSALDVASEDVNEIVVNPPLELIEDTEDLVNETIEAITPENSEVSIAKSTLSNLEYTDKKLTEALVKLLVIFVSSIVKLWFKVNRYSQLSTAIKGYWIKCEADIKVNWQWFIKGFSIPSFT